MQRPAINTLWWLRHDWVTCKVPVVEGKVLLPHEYLEPGYRIDVNKQQYRFIHGREDRRELADFSGLSNGTLFVNERVLSTFLDIFTRHGRVFPVRCNIDSHYIILVDTMHDAVDLKRSKFEQSEIEADIENDISRVIDIVLRDNFSTTDDMFRIDQGFALSQEIIVSDAFKLRYEKAGMTGLFFTLAYNSGAPKN